MNAPELLPCPFCGAKPMIRKYRENLVSVYCGNEKCFTWPDSDAKTLEAAALQWNTRVPPPLTPEAVHIIRVALHLMKSDDIEVSESLGEEADTEAIDRALASLPAKEG